LTNLDRALILDSLPNMAVQTNRFGVFTKNSKFNTSKVIGEALKTAAAGRRVLVVQFLKGGIHQGEGHMINLAQNLDWIRSDSARQLNSGELNESETKSLLNLWQHVQELMRSVEYQLVVLEDLRELVDLRIVDQGEVDQLLQKLPASVEVIIPDMLLENGLELQAS
jgi:cob(I)alamin adenosyltransferase